MESSVSDNHKHGEKGECPTCGAPGTFDMEGERVNFEDSIWFNKACNNWECVECWLK